MILPMFLRKPGFRSQLLNCLLLVAFVTPILLRIAAAATTGQYFAIQVVDQDTGRGVPLVELKTTNQQAHYTDSNGWIALFEPGLMNQEVFFHIKSHGYEYPKDGFGYRGKALKVASGRKETIRIKRVNVAERLYRVTGEGIYRDSLLLGIKPPIARPVLNGGVTGQDTVVVAPYKNQLYWFWGDTERLSYPLGNFAASGARSKLPVQGGLKPDVGVDLDYFVDEKGFSKKMCPLPGGGLVWLEGVFTSQDLSGKERLLATYTRQKGLTPPDERGIALFNDSRELFEPLVRFKDKRGHESSHPFRVNVAGKAYWYLFEDWRVPDQWSHVTNEMAYQAYTCLKPGSVFQGSKTMLDRDSIGNLKFSWQEGAQRLLPNQQEELVRLGLMKPGEKTWQISDLDTGKPIPHSRGSISWNPYRKRWLMLCSAFGSVWLSQADTPTGPWRYARKIVQHDDYTFYNPAHHPYFDENNGRTLYFEGTYTAEFSGAKEKTPRYNYNQIMYRLSLGDPRTLLPNPIYKVKSAKGEEKMFLEQIQATGNQANVVGIESFAFNSSEKSDGLASIKGDKPQDGVWKTITSSGPLEFVQPGSKSNP